MADPASLLSLALKTKGRRKRATLRGVWWRAQMDLLRCCYACGGTLERRYVRAEAKRRHVCVRCGTITYVNPKVVAGLIPVLSDGRVALLRRDIEPARGRWSYPAGYQEMGETVAQAAARETWEEIRTRVRRPRLLGIYSYADAGVVTIVYVAPVPRGERPSPGIESQEIGLFRPEDIPWKTLAFRSTAEALQDWLTEKKREEKTRRVPRARNVRRR